MTQTSKQYALALFSLALEKKQAEEVFEEFHAFVGSLDTMAMKLFLNPKIQDIEKHKVLESVLKNQLLIHFMKTVVDNKRFHLVDEIMMMYKGLLNESNHTVELNVYSKSKLTKTEMNKIELMFSSKLNKKIIINEVIDSSIIGGLRFEYQGEVLDQTINASLEQLSSSLIG